MTYNDIIERALYILKNDETLSRKVREFRFGHLSDIADIAEQYPAIHIISSRPYRSGDTLGRYEDVDLQHSTTVSVKVMVSGPEVEKVARDMNDLLEEVVNAFKSNPRFFKAGKDPIFIRSLPTAAEVMTNTLGKTKQIGMVEVTGQIGSSYDLTFNGITVPVIAKPSSRRGEELTPHFTTGAILGGYAPTGTTENRVYELEYSADAEVKLKELMTGRGVTEIVETREGTDFPFRAMCANYATSVSPDGLETITVMFVR